jgi:transcriptional regulator with XRE-family HTH domain
MPISSNLSPVVATVPLSTKEAAAYIGCSPRTLSNWRSRGAGPTFVRFGAKHSRVAYLTADLDAFLAEHRSSGAPDDIEAAIAAGKAAGKKLAETPLTEEQKALLGTLISPLTVMTTKSTSTLPASTGKGGGH